jgi:hypothetical protein
MLVERLGERVRARPVRDGQEVDVLVGRVRLEGRIDRRQARRADRPGDQTRRLVGLVALEFWGQGDVGKRDAGPLTQPFPQKAVEVEIGKL